MGFSPVSPVGRLQAIITDKEAGPSIATLRVDLGGKFLRANFFAAVVTMKHLGKIAERT